MATKNLDGDGRSETFPARGDNRLLITPSGREVCCQPP